MAKRVHLAGIFVPCMSSVPRAFVRTPNSRAALTIHAKLFTFTRVKCVHTHVCVKFKVSGTVLNANEYLIVWIAIKNYGFQNFYTFKNNLTTSFSQKNQPGCINAAVIRLYLCQTQ